MSSEHAPTSDAPPERLSHLPTAERAERLAARLLDPGELGFLRALRSAGRLDELEGDELLRVIAAAQESDSLERRIDLLEAYYDPARPRGPRRRQADRFFLQRADTAVTSRRLVESLAALAPELPEVALERLGADDDGPLVLRSGEHFAAVIDEYEEALDTGQIDLRELESHLAPRVPTVTLRGLVHALNALLHRHGVRERLVPLRSDELREVYVGASVTDAVALAHAGCLDDADVEAVMELGGW